MPDKSALEYRPKPEIKATTDTVNSSDGGAVATVTTLTEQCGVDTAIAAVGNDAGRQSRGHAPCTPDMGHDRPFHSGAWCRKGGCRGFCGTVTPASDIARALRACRIA